MVFYRYENPGDRIHLYEYPFLKETPKGYWIGVFFEGEKWVSKTARKRFAYPTKELALESFKARKNRQILLLTTQLIKSKKALIIAEDMIV